MSKKLTISQITVIGVMTAVICILGPFSIPIGIVPISFTSFAIYLSVYALGMKNGTISYMIYLLIGFIGIPVFSNFTSGPTKLLGPTGGYLIGFIFMALLSGAFIDRFIKNRILCLFGMVLGILATYLLGTIWLSYQAHLTMVSALSVGVIPFIPGDLIKIVLALIIGPILRTQLQKANLYPGLSTTK